VQPQDPKSDTFCHSKLTSCGNKSLKIQQNLAFFVPIGVGIVPNRILSSKERAIRDLGVLSPKK